MKRVKLPLISVEDNYESMEFGTDKGFPYEDLSEYNNYEVTVTFNQRLHTKASAFAAEKAIIQYLLTYTKALALRSALEYQKNGMPHYHMMITTEEPLDMDLRVDLYMALNRRYGSCTFRDVLDYKAYQEYMAKDIFNNERKHGFKHMKQYLII